MVDWLSLAVPLAYLGVLIGSLATFSSLYRKRKAQKSLSLEPWFPAHLQRDVYFSLLHLDPAASSSSTKEKKAPAVPETVLKAALMRRATEDIRRVMALRTQKQALAMLLQRGSVGDDLWQRFQRAEKEMEEEVREVVAEANTYTPNWGQTIFQSANEMLNNIGFRKRMEVHQIKLQEEKDWWAKKRATAQEELMRELDDEKASASKPAAESKPAATATATPTTTETTTDKTATTPAAPISVAGSDDDAVLVEAEEQQQQATETGSAPGTPSGGKKKKKGKK
ncbi:hypothetical protein ASPZODRAFT_133317 [Penicilliopsis zonata CBS 506.65]|uniref:Translocation protein sec66 n=1 Tax=Penicilliopsis zonata CBS 506.65 TaxID=1073090 RepID=A0A1L9SGN0_9EURO|nr:hypothetical protein ASPZODRAFT_133317 [Penicilliopsis zonata CBS 506.65]OJJ46288.1 hypothetical protein ASPZODRAFT_133317 [Penicilliopsis zonata CBS 506.65]